MVHFPRRVCKPIARGCPFVWFLKSKSHPIKTWTKKNLYCVSNKGSFPQILLHMAIGPGKVHVRFMGGRRIVVMR